MSNMTVSGNVYSVDLSPTGTITGTSIYLFGTIQVTFTIVAQDLSY
jgi:S-ribosylhomocysteine lyase LuxS involved in autoinducer biosynthesis